MVPEPWDQSSRDETPRRPATSDPSGGRPRLWSGPAEKHRAHRKRRAQQQRLVEELLLAVRNARLEEPELHRVAQYGDDTALLEALVHFYRERHWQLGRKETGP